VLAWSDVEGLALAEVLLTAVMVALEDTELADGLWLAELLDDELIEALLEANEELTLDGKPWVLLEETLATVWLDEEDEAVRLRLEVVEGATTLWVDEAEDVTLWLEGVDEITLWLEATEEALGLWLEEALGLWLDEAGTLWLDEALELWLEEAATFWLEETLELWLEEAKTLWLEEALELWLGETDEELALSLLDDEDAQVGLGIPIEYELSDVEAEVLERTLAVLDTVELPLETTEDEKLLWPDAGAETDARLPL
jgi:hypothetical protein